MEFNEKLQELRKRKNLTQEQLAEELYVSRTAISKWESGRGYPGIDSLKAIAKFFSVTIDDLLSGDEVLSIAEEERQQNEKWVRDLVFGLLDCSAVVLLFFPFFGQTSGEMISAVSLLALSEAASYMKAAYVAVVLGMVGYGILTLALRRLKGFGERNGTKGSLLLNACGVLVLVMGSQPYAATLLFVFLAIKVLMLVKKP